MTPPRAALALALFPSLALASAPLPPGFLLEKLGRMGKINGNAKRARLRTGGTTPAITGDLPKLLKGAKKACKKTNGSALPFLARALAVASSPEDKEKIIRVAKRIARRHIGEAGKMVSPFYFWKRNDPARVRFELGQAMGVARVVGINVGPVPRRVIERAGKK